MRRVVIGVEGIEPDQILNHPRLIHVKMLVEEGVSGHLLVERHEGLSTLWSAFSPKQERRPTPSSVGADVEPFQIGDDDGLWIDQRTTSEGRPRDASDSGSRVRSHFEELRQRMGCEPWSQAGICLGFPGPSKDAAEDQTSERWLVDFDDELGRTLEHLIGSIGEVTILLVVLGRPLGDGSVDTVGESPTGAFVMTSSRGLPAGRIEGARLIDLAPTLLKLAGSLIPDDLPGTPLELDQVAPRGDEDEQAVLERLRGLGYLG